VVGIVCVCVCVYVTEVTTSTNITFMEISRLMII